MIASLASYCGSAAGMFEHLGGALIVRNLRPESNRNVPYDRIDHPAAAWVN